MPEEQKREFTGVWIPRHIIEDTRLKPVDRMIYAEIACFDECYMSNEQIAKRAGCSEATAKRSVTRMKESGYLLQTKFDGRRRWLKALHDKTVQYDQAVIEPGHFDQADSANSTKQTAQNDLLDNNIDNIEKTSTDKSVGVPPRSSKLAVVKNDQGGRQIDAPTDIYGKPEINELFQYWHDRLGYQIQSRKQANRNACNNLLKKHGPDGLRRAIEGVAIAQDDKYAPRIADFADLQSKWNALMVWGKQRSTNSGIIAIID